MSQGWAKTTGVVLSGGEGRRMGGLDKGLMRFRGKPLIAYALNALESVAATILISANRNQDSYARSGYRVLSDQCASFEGPLAGLLSAMRHADTPYVMVVPCDSPLIQAIPLERLYDTLLRENAEICVAHDGRRLQPLFMIVDQRLCGSLESYLASGERKVDRWLNQHKLALADYSDQPGLFVNVNTPEDLAALEGETGPSQLRL